MVVNGHFWVICSVHEGHDYSKVALLNRLVAVEALFAYRDFYAIVRVAHGSAPRGRAEPVQAEPTLLPAALVPSEMRQAPIDWAH